MSCMVCDAQKDKNAVEFQGRHYIHPVLYTTMLRVVLQSVSFHVHFETYFCFMAGIW